VTATSTPGTFAVAAVVTLVVGGLTAAFRNPASAASSGEQNAAAA